MGATGAETNMSEHTEAGKSGASLLNLTTLEDRRLTELSYPQLGPTGMMASEEGTALPLSSGRWSDVSSVLPCATMNQLTNHQQPLVAPTTTCEPSYGKEEPLFQPHATRTSVPMYPCTHKAQPRSHPTTSKYFAAD